jgi:hydroxyacylglutathione hydrolase
VTPYDKPIYLIIDEAHIDEAVYDLRYVGFDQIEGFFTPDVIDYAESESSSLRLIKPEQVIEDVKKGTLQVIDVRNENEYRDGHIPGSENIPLGELQDSMGRIKNNDQEILLICRSGGRSFVAATLLRSQGFKNVMNLAGGIQAWALSQYPIRKPSDLHRAA